MVFLPLVPTYLTTVPVGLAEVYLRLPTYAVANTTTFGGHQGVPKVSCKQAKALDVCGAQLERPQCLHTFVEVGLKALSAGGASASPSLCLSLTRSPRSRLGDQ